MPDKRRIPTVLITNDDGPPGEESPFIEAFVGALHHSLGWRTKVCIPSNQRSWIGKALLVNETVALEKYKPPTKDGSGDDVDECWYLATGTPASCVNIALHHLFADIDLVISGPNLGSNVANTCAFASGTLGAAMEAALNGTCAAALSFAFYNRDISPAKTQNACAMACSVLDRLWQADMWGTCGAGVFNINVPLVDVADRPVYLTAMGRSRFGSLYRKTSDTNYDASINPVTGLHIKTAGAAGETNAALAIGDGEDPAARKCSETTADTAEDGSSGLEFVFSSSAPTNKVSGPGTDSWAVRHRFISVTPLRPELQSLGSANCEALWSSLGFNFAS
ncbi:sure-like protein [Martensiomyces pterosporus]|nr:sure-like protein [Martensiomyces pterosporus]